MPSFIMIGADVVAIIDLTLPLHFRRQRRWDLLTAIAAVLFGVWSNLRSRASDSAGY